MTSRLLCRAQLHWFGRLPGQMRPHSPLDLIEFDRIYLIQRNTAQFHRWQAHSNRAVLSGRSGLHTLRQLL